MLHTEQHKPHLLTFIGHRLQDSIQYASEGGRLRRELVRNLVIYPIEIITRGHESSRRHADWQKIHDSAQQAIQDLRRR